MRTYHSLTRRGSNLASRPAGETEGEDKGCPPTHHEMRMDQVAATDLFRDTMHFYNQFAESYKNASVLDVGAGSGTVSAVVATWQNVKRVVAYDKTKEMMRRISPHPKITIATGGSHLDLPFGTAKFDVVICRYVLHHLTQQQKALTEMRRVLKAKALLLLSDLIMPEHSRDVVDTIFRVREDHFQRHLTYCEVIRCLEEAGFAPLMIRPARFRNPDLVKHMEAIDTSNNDRLEQRASSILKRKLLRAWDLVDATVVEELAIKGKGLRRSFSYYLVDVAARAV